MAEKVVYAESRKTNEVYGLEDREIDSLCGVYFHGEIYRDDIMDFVYIYIKDDYEPKVNTIDDVTVVFPDGTTERAWLYYWESNNKYEYSTIYGGGMPIETEMKTRKGLVCKMTDKEANEYACQCFNERRRYL